MGGEKVLGAALVLAIAGVTGSVLFGEHGITHLLRLRTEQRQLADVAFVLLDRNEKLRTEIEGLRRDDLRLEELARQRLGLVRPGEFVYRFRPDGG